MPVDETSDSLIPLLQAAGRRDAAALKTLYERTSAKLLGVCLRILPSREEAEDVLQDVYVTVWAKAAGYDAQRGNPITWLATIARNKAIDRLRARKSQGGERPLNEHDVVADLSPNAMEQLVATQDGKRLQECLSKLDVRTRTAIAEAFFGGHTYDEMARKMNVPLGTMKTWIRRGLLGLRHCLES